MNRILILITSIILIGCDSPPNNICDAAYYGNIEAVKSFLEDGTNINAKDDKYGATPLHEAASRGHIEIAKLLISKKANVDSKGKYGETPLHRAVLGGHADLVDLLIQKKANVNAKEDDGTTVLESAIKYKETKIIELLRNHGGKTTEELNTEDL